MKVEERLLKYVSIWTTSDEENAVKCPSSERQWNLARLLKREMELLGLDRVFLSDQCYVYGLLSATEGFEKEKAMGLISHMDTSPSCSGQNVKPQVIPDYDGEDVVLKGTGAILSPGEFGDLKRAKGETLITTDGTTLLGADDKAGIAEIMTAIEELKKKNIPHGDIWIGFTPDEEIGQGADHFDLSYFEAEYAYTVDGSYEGDLEIENFNAWSAVFRIQGKNVHPGSAKNIMKNAALIAAELAASMPADQTPATTEGREGFYHLCGMKGDCEHAELVYIIRDHDKKIMDQRLAYLKEKEEFFNREYGLGTVELTLHHSYDNMIEILKDHMDIVDAAEAAIRKTGLIPSKEPVRGGTDGARLSFMGLPCPNLGTGGYAFHGPYEHITVQAMERAVQNLVNLCGR